MKNLQEHLAEVKRQHPSETPEQHQERAAYRHKELKYKATGEAEKKLGAWRAPLTQREYLRLIVLLLILLCVICSKQLFAQTTVIRGQTKGVTPAANATVTATSADHNGVDVNIVGGGGSGGTASNFGAAFPATGTAVGASDGVNMGPLLVDASGYLKVNCLVGCAGGATTPSDAFANPTTAGLQAAFNMLYNGATWDRARGDTTNGLWVNCKNGCAGGSSTPSDAFANPTTAGLSQAFNMMWNGATWDRVKGDTTSGIWINVKNSTLAVTQSGGWSISFTAPQHVIVDSATLGTVQVQSNSANIATEATVAGIKTGTDKIPAQGQALAAASLPVVLTALQLAALTPPAAISNFALETGGNLAAIKTDVDKIPSQGQALAAASMPVVLPAAQISTLTPLSSVTATQATGSNLHVVVDTAPTTAVTNAGLTDLDGAIAANGAAPPANVVATGGVGSGATGGLMGRMIACDLYAPISVTANTQLITGTASRTIYICSINLVAGAATNVAIVAGTGTVCATGIAGIFGGTTAATGWNFSANGGIAHGSGVGMVAKTASTGQNLCILVSAANQVSGGISYAVF